jgi:phosphoribosylanthranilate isomerase
VSAVRIKVCCIANIAEAELAVRHGASALGLVSAMPSGPGPIAEERIAEIAATVPPGVATFLLTSKTDADGIIEQQLRCRCNTLQLVDAVDPRIYPKLRRAMPGIKLVQVIHVVGNASVGEALDLAPHVDALLLDSGNPGLAVKELGGTGRTHDWSLSRYIVTHAGKPVILAGGLRPDNVAEAVRTVQPYGVDLCNGIRTHGALDAEKLAAFVEAVRAA